MRSLLKLSILGLCIGTLSAQTPPHGIMAPVTTRAYNNARTGMNPNETIFTVANVKAQGIRKYFSLPMEGDARGTEAQPLIEPNVTMEDGTIRDVAIITSMNNLVYAFDANTSDILWVKKLGIPINGSVAIDMHNINDHWGNLSTGVIDPDTKIWYGVAWTSPDSSAAKGGYSIYALDIASGTLIKNPVPLASVTFQPAGGGAKQTYSSIMRKQRSSLLLTNINNIKTVFFASGTVAETSNGAAGWIMAYDIATNSIAAAMTMTAGDGAGIWMGGQGLAADSKGFIYGETGNGNFNGIDNFGECAFKVQYIPANGAIPASLKLIDWWSPWSDAGRIGQAVTKADLQRLPMKMSGVSAPSELVRQKDDDKDDDNMPVNGMKMRDFSKAHYVGNLLYPNAAANNAAWSDEDLGSAQGALIEPMDTFLVGGKDGISYPVRMSKMGKTMPADFANAKANCAKLVSSPIWATASPGPVDPCPQDPTTLNFLPWGKTRHQHSTPVQYQSSVHGRMIFFWGENSQLHAWNISPAGALTYLAQGNEIASANVVNPPGGMPGGFMTMSSNNSKAGTAILWATIPYGDANTTVTNGRLLAYDPDNFVTNADGSKTLAVIWDSQAVGIPFVFNKFDPPVVSGGKLFVPTYSDTIDVYGLN